MSSVPGSPDSDQTRRIVLRGGEGDGWEMYVPKMFPVNYAEDGEGTMLYVNSGNVDEDGREIWVPLEDRKEDKNGHSD